MVRLEINKNEGTCVYQIISGEKVYEGKSKLHPDDEGFFSEKRGLSIAETRAKQKKLNNKIHQTGVKIAQLEQDLKRQIMKREQFKKMKEIEKTTEAELLKNQEILVSKVKALRKKREV